MAFEYARIVSDTDKTWFLGPLTLLRSEAVNRFTAPQTVSIQYGCLGFIQGRGMRNVDWTSGWSPFHINFLFQKALIRNRGDHLHYLDDYSRWTTSNRSSSSDGEIPTFDAGMLALDADWREVSVDNYYYHPVIVAPAPSYACPDPAHVRLGEYANQGFAARVEEWAYLNGSHNEIRNHPSDGVEITLQETRSGDPETTHLPETVSYLVIEN